MLLKTFNTLQVHAEKDNSNVSVTYMHCVGQNNRYIGNMKRFFLHRFHERFSLTKLESWRRFVTYIP